jgi:hypothetical protein
MRYRPSLSAVHVPFLDVLLNVGLPERFLALIVLPVRKTLFIQALFA